MLRRMFRAGQTEAGYTYVAMLVLLVAIALAAQVTFVPTTTSLKRAAEAELIFRGQEYARAIASYRAFEPENPAYPPRLQDLFEDPRDGGARHIRRLYETGVDADWEGIPSAGGGIAGVTVKSPEKPFRQSQLPLGVIFEEDSNGYTVWIFLPSES